MTGRTLSLQSISLVDVLFDPVTRKIYHIEGRPSEGGRNVIVDTIANREVFGPDWDATTAVHEYGRGAAIVHDGTIYFSHSDGRVYSFKNGSEPRAVTPGEHSSSSPSCHCMSNHPLLRSRKAVQIC